MPKIEADSVAQHRANREQALVDAARHLLLTDGITAVTPSNVAARIGLARSAVYTYIHSGRHLLARLIDEDFTSWATHVDTAVRAAGPDPHERLHTYARATLQLAAAGTHQVVTALWDAPLDEQLRSHVDALRHQLAAPLRAALADRGDDAPDTTAALAQSIVDAAMQLIRAGRPADPVVQRALQFLRAGHR